MISDTRRLTVYQIVSSQGKVERNRVAEVWQDQETGKLGVSGLWDVALISSCEDLTLMAEELKISNLELLQNRLASCSAIKVEVVE